MVATKRALEVDPAAPARAMPGPTEHLVWRDAEVPAHVLQNRVLSAYGAMPVAETDRLPPLAKLLIIASASAVLWFGIGALIMAIIA